MSGLLPQDYEIPTGGSGGLFAKLEKGENRFRILAKPVFGYIYWDNNAPVRIQNPNDYKTDEKPKDLKHFWNVPVYMNDEIKYMEIDKATVLKDLAALDSNKEWGNLLEYDVIVTRSGEGMDTKYSTNPCKPTKLSAEAEEAWKDAKAEYDRYTTEDLFESELFPTKKTEEEKLPF
jgi:hypothetical protein